MTPPTSPGDPPAGPTPLLAVAWKVLASLAVLLILMVGVGVALPGTWTAEGETTLAAGPESVFPWLNAPSLWQRWNPWPDVQVTSSGPEAGVGATMAWDDPYAGSGHFRIVESHPPDRLVYQVEVQGGSIRMRGVFELTALAEGGTRVHWREDGDFGWNPLMGYAALTMHRVQSVEIERGLERLRSAIDSLAPHAAAIPPGS